MNSVAEKKRRDKSKKAKSEAASSEAAKDESAKDESAKDKKKQNKGKSKEKGSKKKKEAKSGKKPGKGKKKKKAGGKPRKSRGKRSSDSSPETDSSQLVAGLPSADDRKGYRRRSSQGSDSDFRAKPVSSRVKERWYVQQALKEAEGFFFRQSPGWTKPTVEAATYVVHDDGVPDTLPVGPNMRCMDEAVLAGIVEQFSSMPLDRIHHFALNGEFMYGLFRDKKLVDMLIHVDDRMFCGHRNVLAAHSNYFASILVDNDVPPYKVTDVTLTNVNPDMFMLFLHFAYTGDVFVTMKNLVPLKNLATALQSSTLRARLLLYMSKKSLLTLQEALYILCNNIEADETPLAIEVVKMNYMKVLEDVESLGRFSVDDFEDIISSTNLCVNSELDVFWSVLFWVATDPANRINHLNRLMREVRFTNMSSLELMDCARVSELVRLSKSCKTLLISANWVCHARELGLQDPLGLPQQPKRQCLFGRPPHEPTVAEFDHRFLVYTMLVEKNAGSFELSGVKLGVSFDNVDDVTKFVYPDDDQPMYPEADYNDLRSMVKGLSESSDLEDWDPYLQPTQDTDSDRKEKKAPKKKKKEKKKKGEKTPRPAKTPQKRKGSDAEAPGRRRSSLGSCFGDDKEANQSANTNMTANAPVRHDDSPVLHIVSPGRDRDSSIKHSGLSEVDPESVRYSRMSGVDPESVRHSDLSGVDPESVRHSDLSEVDPESVRHSDLSEVDPESVRHSDAPGVIPDPLHLWESTILPSTQAILSQGPVLQPVKTQKLTLTRTRADGLRATEKLDGSSQSTALTPDDGSSQSTALTPDDGRYDAHIGRQCVGGEVDPTQEGQSPVKESRRDAGTVSAEDTSNTPSDQVKVGQDQKDARLEVVFTVPRSRIGSLKPASSTDLMRFE